MVPIEFAHVGMGCKDPLAVEQFYVKYFGFQRARVIPLGSEQIVFLKSGAVYLELFLAKEPSPLAPPDKDGYPFPGLKHLAFQVASVDAKLQELGRDAKITLGPFDFNDFIKGWRTVWVADPEGNIIEISQGYVDQENPPAL